MGIARFSKLVNRAGGTAVISTSGNILADNEVARGDGASNIQGSTVLLSDTGTFSGVQGISSDSTLDLTTSGAGDTLTISAGGSLSTADSEGWNHDSELDVQLRSRGSIAVLSRGPVATTGASVAGKSATLQASPAIASTDTAGAAAGGSVNITAGAAARNTSGNANGGDINLNTGAGIGTGTKGLLKTDATTIQGGASAVYSAASGTVQLGTSGGASCSLAGLWTVNGSTGVLSNSSGYPAVCGIAVRPKTTSPISVVVSESRGVYTNEGAGGSVTFNLPTAVAGYDYTFIVQATQNMVVTASAGDTIRVAAGVSSAGGTATNGTIGSTLRIVSINNTEWVALGAPNGTWSLA